MVSGRDLTPFFTQWLDGTATCDYSVESLQVRQVAGRYESAVRVRRRGDIVMPVVVRVAFDEGAPRDLVWDGRDRDTTLRLQSPVKPHAAIVDPERRLLETNVENNAYPRRRVIALSPLAMPEDAYALAWMPIVWFNDRGPAYGAMLAYGGPPELGLPYGIRRQNSLWALVTTSPRHGTAAGRVSYSTPADRLGGRGILGVTLAAEPGETRAAVSQEWFFGGAFYQQPTHRLEVSFIHDRIGPDAALDDGRTPFTAGAVDSLRTRYLFNRLTTDYFPLRGRLVDASVEVGLPSLGSDWSFARATLRAEQYWPIGGRSKLALSAFHGATFGGAPLQRALWLTTDGHFAASSYRSYGGAQLTAVNTESRTTLASTTLAAALFLNVATTWSGAASRPFAEGGAGLRFFDNAPFAIQIDWPFWSDNPMAAAAGPRVGARRLVVRVGRVFERR
jgi:hypothetical protein